jgi:hypothetical protein
MMPFRVAIPNSVMNPIPALYLKYGRAEVTQDLRTEGEVAPAGD